MYEAFFGLQSRPFTTGPRPELYFPGAAIEAGRQILGRCIERSEGTGILIGPAGTGKTLLLQVLATQFQSMLEIAYLSSGRLASRKELLQAILFELGLSYRGLDEGESRLALIDHLSQPAQGRQGLLLLIDEAHTLPLKLLEELRLLTNLVRQGQPRVRLVLAGGPVLEERFASPKLEALNQRLAARCYLEGFERLETMEYIRTQIRLAAGSPDQVFAPDALDAIHRATEGIPRLINQVCDHALILAFAGGERPLKKLAIDEAWADLQQLPTPWNSAAGAPEKASSTSPSIIEFGSLDDELDEGPAAVPFRSSATETVPSTMHFMVSSEDTDEEEEEEELEDLAQNSVMSAAQGPFLQPQPDVQLTRIESQLSSLAIDFDEMDGPATAPNKTNTLANQAVDVVYPPIDHPFQDQFDEEEVVVDRYATLTAEIFRDRQHVSSREGQELSRLLAPFEIAANESAIAIAANTTWSVEPEQKSNLSSAQSGELPSRNEMAETALVPTAKSSAPAPTDEVEPLMVEVMEAEILEEDADMIVIEELPRENPAAYPAHAAPARRQEYRQLFAKLRRG